MAVTDSPTTRIKADNAKQALSGGAANSGLVAQRLLQQFAFQAVVVMHFDRSRPPLLSASAYDTDSERVMRDWAVNVVSKAPDGVKKAVGAVIFAIGKEGRLEVATWGESKTDMNALNEWGGATLRGVSLCPMQTWFGHGTGGIPKPLAPEKFEALSDNLKAFVLRNTRG